MSAEIAARVTQGVQALALPGQRESWQAQHRESLLADAASYEYLADALEADLRQRGVDGDMPWSAGRRARKRAKPLRQAAKAMRRAARSVGGTVAAYEATAPEQVAAEREAKALAKAQRKGQLAAAAANASTAALERMAPAEGKGQAAGKEKVLGDFFPTQKGA